MPAWAVMSRKVTFCAQQVNGSAEAINHRDTATQSEIDFFSLSSPDSTLKVPFLKSSLRSPPVFSAFSAVKSFSLRYAKGEPITSQPRRAAPTHAHECSAARYCPPDARSNKAQ